MKSTYPQTPAAIEAALVTEGMDYSQQMGPGRPLNPWTGYSQQPRATDLVREIKPEEMNVPIKNKR